MTGGEGTLVKLSEKRTKLKYNLIDMFKGQNPLSIILLLFLIYYDTSFIALNLAIKCNISELNDRIY